jgi:hypothetical protein
MGLSITDGGILEKIINQEIARIPSEIKPFKDPKLRNRFQLKEPNDFIFGVAFGSILADFSSYYTHLYQNQPDQSEVDEAISVITNRMAEIRNAIFNSG